MSQAKSNPIKIKKKIKKKQKKTPTNVSDIYKKMSHVEHDGEELEDRGHAHI